jgi:hypothetical protein
MRCHSKSLLSPKVKKKKKKNRHIQEIKKIQINKVITLKIHEKERDKLIGNSLSCYSQHHSLYI